MIYWFIVRVNVYRPELTGNLLPLVNGYGAISAGIVLLIYRG